MREAPPTASDSVKPGPVEGRRGGAQGRHQDGFLLRCERRLEAVQFVAERVPIRLRYRGGLFTCA